MLSENVISLKGFKEIVFTQKKKKKARRNGAMPGLGDGSVPLSPLAQCWAREPQSNFHAHFASPPL